MRRNTILVILTLAALPLLGFSCVNFRYFSVRPHLAEGVEGALTIERLAADYEEVVAASRAWAAGVGAAEETCGVYAEDQSDTSPACVLFRGDDYSVSVEFAPSANSTSVLVSSFKSGTSDRVWKDLKVY